MDNKLKAGVVIKYGAGKLPYTLKAACADNFVKGAICAKDGEVINAFDVDEHDVPGHKLFTWCTGHGPEAYHEVRL